MLFGTDGIRGLVNIEIDSRLAFNIGKGLALYINTRKLIPKVVIGSDTRNSSCTYISSLSAGLSEYGINVDVVGVVATPMISFLVSRNNYSCGLMITASHNDSNYNGIKIFNSFGEKLDIESEMEIEQNINKSINKPIIKGIISYIPKLIEQYYYYLKYNFDFNLKDKKIVLDCANGSNYKLAPMIYKHLGANVIKLSCNGDGFNINENCGANHIENLLQWVVHNDADIGFAFDGDGDRLRVVLRDGTILTGDDILLIFSICLKRKFNLKNQTVAGTILTNLGVEKNLNSYNINLIRSDVGDKNLVNLMIDNSLSIGAESSGHLCLLNHIPSCDALYNSLFFMKCLLELGDDFYKIIKTNKNYPTLTSNINVDKKFREDFDQNIQLSENIDKIQKEYMDAKIVVRPSGTEPVIRIYIESRSNRKNHQIMQQVEKIIKN